MSAQDINGKIVDRNQAKKLPIEQLHMKVHQTFFLPTILYSLRDTTGAFIDEHHPFVEYLKSKIGYTATASQDLPMFWKYMTPQLAPHYAYRAQDLTISEIKDRRVWELLKTNNIDVFEASFFECFFIKKLEFQISRRCKFTHNSSWVQFKYNDRMYCGKLREAFHVGENFKVVVETAMVEFMSHCLQFEHNIETMLILADISSIIDQCVYVSTEKTYSLFPLHSECFEVPTIFTMVDTMEDIQETYTNDEWETLQTTHKYRHVYSKE
jgi:hypothetical protein